VLELVKDCYLYMKIKKGSLKYFILLALEELDRKGLLETFSYSAQIKHILNMSSLYPNTKRSYLVESIRRLRRDGLLEQEKSDDGKRILKLSQLGKDFLKVGNESWDGKYRIVIWDIPESKRRIRNLFRRRIKDWNFKVLQKSVWISKENVTSQLRKLISELDLEKWVLVIESEDPTLSKSNRNLADRPR